MSMIRWDPFEDMNRLWEQVNRLFEQSVTQTGREACTTQIWVPAVDIIETEVAIILCLELPGISSRSIDIQMSEDTLTIKGERKMATVEGTLLRSERQFGPFQRSFTLGMPINNDEVSANYHDGILEVTLPKKEVTVPKPVKIQVQAVDEPAEILAE